MEAATEAGVQAGADQVPERLDTLLAQYSAGAISRRELEQASSLWFGDILAELGRRGLPLPRVDSSVHFNAVQLALYERVFG